MHVAGRHELASRPGEKRNVVGMRTGFIMSPVIYCQPNRAVMSKGQHCATKEAFPISSSPTARLGD